MGTFLDRLAARFRRLEHWFDHRFGWFFTNGMKEQQQADRLRS